MTARIKVISTSYLYTSFCCLPFYLLIIYLFIIQCMFLDFVPITFSLSDLTEDSFIFPLLLLEQKCQSLRIISNEACEVFLITTFLLKDFFAFLLHFIIGWLRLVGTCGGLAVSPCSSKVIYSRLPRIMSECVF